MQKPLWMVLIVGAWTLTSFLCHFLAKLFLRTTSDNGNFTMGLISSLIITGHQMVYCKILTNTDTAAETTRTAVRLMQIAHVLATLATNFSMAVTHASSTFAIKLMEPITGAIAQRIVIGNKLTALQYACLPVIVIGSVMFAEDLRGGFSISIGTLIAFMSNILLATRNVIIKSQHMSNKSLTIESPKRWIYVACTSVFVIMGSSTLARVNILPHEIPTWITYAVLSAFFHVTYSYISTVVVLAEFSVVGHAICNIIKRLVVVGLLLATGRRVASEWNAYGLAICAAGLTVYTISKTSSLEVAPKATTTTSGLNIRPFNVFSSTCLQKRHALLLMLMMCVGTLSIFGVASDKKDIILRRDVSMVRDARNEYLFGKSYLDPPDVRKQSDLTFRRPNISLSHTTLNDPLEADLVENPELADAISPYLTTRVEVIAEAQRIHMNIFKTLLAGRKKVMLFHYSPSENKGDSAIAVGEFILLRKLNVEIIFHCPLGSCMKQMDKADKAKGNLTSKELVMLFHGGGNVIGYSIADVWRNDVIKHYPDFDIIMFPQSIYLHGSQQHKDFCKRIYASHKSLTFLWRDRGSYKLGKQMFPKVRSLLSPDIAYQLGPIPRTMAPQYDIIWIKRKDGETPGYQKPTSVEGHSFHVDDWLTWPTPRGTGPMENVFLMTHVGLAYLQRGRVVITDRLHGHILSTLLEIPHVFIDNKEHKISNYHKTWTRGVDNLVYTNSSAQAISQAKLILEKLEDELPTIVGY